MQFFTNRQQAKSALARVNGFCVNGTSIIATSYGQCHNRHGSMFFTEKRAAHKKATSYKKTAGKKVTPSRSKMTPPVSDIHHNKLSGIQYPATGTIHRKIPGTAVSNRLEQRLRISRIKDRMASMNDAQAAKNAGLVDADPGTKKESGLTNPLTDEPITLGRTLRDPITGEKIGKSGLERNHFDEIGRISGDHQHDGSDHTDEMREAAGRGNDMAMTDPSDKQDNSSSKTTSKEVVNDATVVFKRTNVTFGEVDAMLDHNMGSKITAHLEEHGITLTLMRTGDRSVLVIKTLSNGAQIEQHFIEGEKPGPSKWVDPDTTEHPDEQRNSGDHKKRKAATYMDLAGNPGPNAQNAKEQNKKKQIFKKDDLAGNPNPQHAERKGKSRDLPDAIMTDLTLSGTPVEEDTDFGEIDPHNPSGNSTHSSNTSSNTQVESSASLPSTKNNRNFATGEQQEEPVVVPDNQ